MSRWIFITRDPQGREVGLMEETFRDHIEGRHPGVTAVMIREVIEGPNQILEYLGEDSINYVARNPRNTRLFRIVGAKRLSRSAAPQWSVSTAFPRALPPPARRILWTRPETP